MDLPDKSQPEVISGKNIKVLGGATQVARPATKRFFDFLFAESPRDLAKKIGREVVVPRLKASFEEAAGSFLSGMLWGGGNRPNPNIVQGTVFKGGAVNYSGISTQNAMLLARQATVQTTSSGNYQDLVVPSVQLAESYLAQLYELLNQYRVVTVADLYEMAAISPAISDGSFGWTSLDSARIRPVGNGYVLELPRPTLI